MVYALMGDELLGSVGSPLSYSRWQKGACGPMVFSSRTEEELKSLQSEKEEDSEWTAKITMGLPS